MGGEWTIRRKTTHYCRPFTVSDKLKWRAAVSAIADYAKTLSVEGTRPYHVTVVDPTLTQLLNFLSDSSSDYETLLVRISLDLDSLVIENPRDSFKHTINIARNLDTLVIHGGRRTDHWCFILGSALAFLFPNKFEQDREHYGTCDTRTYCLNDPEGNGLRGGDILVSQLQTIKENNEPPSLVSITSEVLRQQEISESVSLLLQSIGL